MAVELIDNSPEYIEAVKKAVSAALEAAGAQCVSHVVNILTKDAYKHPVSWYHRTGALKKFSHLVDNDEQVVYIGTNLEYAPYWEYGTGSYADEGGRQGWWVFVPGSKGHKVGSSKVYTEAEARRIMAMLQSKGIDAHMTKGIKPVHMLKRAVEENEDEYREIFEKYLGQVGGSVK